jgi:hypothetical protein
MHQFPIVFSIAVLFQIFTRCNYRFEFLGADLYPSQYENWVSSKSILGVISVVHADVSEPGRGSRTHKELLHDGLFLYNAEYHPRKKHEQYGRLSPLPLPLFDDPAWPLPDMSTTEAFKARMRSDFLTSMKPQSGSKATHLQWFMPFHVMVDLFSVASNMHRTTTFFVFKEVTHNLMASLMDSGWDSKISVGDDVIKCSIDQQSLTFRFHVGRSTLYANFRYNRERLISGSQWEMIDQASPIQVLRIECEFGTWSDELKVGRNWTLANVREEIVVTLGLAAPLDFVLWIINDEQTSEKVQACNS